MHILLFLMYVLFALAFPQLWILAIIGFIIYYIWSFKRKKEKGFIADLDGIDEGEDAILYIYPDRITINDMKIIPIERVYNAEVSDHYHILNVGYNIERITWYILTIHFESVSGEDSMYLFRSKDNPIDGGSAFFAFRDKINKAVGYTPPSPPTVPYEL